MNAVYPKNKMIPLKIKISPVFRLFYDGILSLRLQRSRIIFCFFIAFVKDWIEKEYCILNNYLKIIVIV
ncbi:hypothetical protein DRQ07_03480 [candidate division KSB1 bacterium]|nr:MAG: hypothetical protein DRQ07_03480 [candidate division KSB1 bacterium]